MTARHDRLRAANDGANDAVLRRIELAQAPRRVPGRHVELEDAPGALLDDREQTGTATLNLVQDPGHRGAARRQRHVNAHAFEEPEVRSTTHAREHTAHTELPAEQRGEQVAFIVVDDRHQHIASADILGLEQLQVRPVSTQDQGVAEAAGQELASRGVALDDHHIEILRGLETFGEAEAHVAASDDRDPLPARVSTRRDAVADILQRLRRPHDDGLVAREEFAVATRDEEFVSAPHGHDERAMREMLVGDPAHHRRAGLQAILDETNRTVGEDLGIESARRADDPLDVCGQLGFGPHHVIDAELLEALPVLLELEKIFARDETERARRSQAVPDRARDDVDFVESCAGDQDIGTLDARAAENLGARASAEQKLDVQRLESIRDDRCVIDDDDVVRRGQRLSECEADLTAADDNDSHDPRLYSSGSGRPASAEAGPAEDPLHLVRQIGARERLREKVFALGDAVVHDGIFAKLDATTLPRRRRHQIVTLESDAMPDYTLTDPAVMAFLVIPALLVCMLAWGTAAAWRRSGARDSSVVSATLAATIAAGAWMAVTWVAAASGTLRDWDRVPPPFALLVAAIIALAVAMAYSAFGARIAGYIPLWCLVAVQAFRLPLELAMHGMYTRGIMPVQMSYSGLNFDIVTGATAIPVAALVATGRGGRGLVTAWNAMGLALLLNVVIVAILSTPRLRYFGDEHLNVWVMYPPFVWLPAVMVLAALAGHLVIFRALTGARKPSAR